MSKDTVDLVFRLLFSLIFVGLGGEHMLSNELIKRLMPAWVPMPDYVSIFCGLILMSGGILIIVGYKIRLAAYTLGAFVVVVTTLVHVPAVFHMPEFVHKDNLWLWDILQRSNLAKNLCLLGVCILLSQYKPGKWSVTTYLEQRRKP